MVVHMEHYQHQQEQDIHLMDGILQQVEEQKLHQVQNILQHQIKLYMHIGQQIHILFHIMQMVEAEQQQVVHIHMMHPRH